MSSLSCNILGCKITGLNSHKRRFKHLGMQSQFCWQGFKGVNHFLNHVPVQECFTIGSNLNYTMQVKLIY
jgi:hypothetical protein